ITTGVEAIESQTYQNSTDPHAWMDARNGLIYIENIKNALVQLDPDNTDKYVFNYNYYRQQIEDLNHYIQTEIAKIPTEQRIIITSHDAFQYYGRAYGLRLEAVLGTSTDAEVQVSDIKRLTEVIRNSGIPAVFVETTVNPQLLQQIAADNNITIGGKLYSDSLGDKDSPASTYLDMLTYNTRTIVQALARPARSPKVTEDTTSQEESGSSIPLYAALGVLLIGSLLFVARKMG
ncbi:MAG: zinc ABC transporter substrate-binding protein, partial [Bacteroidota bacterium]